MSCQNCGAGGFLRKGALCVTCYSKDYYKRNKDKYIESNARFQKRNPSTKEKKAKAPKLPVIRKGKREGTCVVCEKTCHIKIDYNVCSPCYRKAHFRYRAAVLRGAVCDLQMFFTKKRVKFTKARGPKYYRSKSALQRALATPKWVEIEAIATIYERCPDGMHVDHIVPINGKNVCGLNVPWNLQYLEKTANIKKGNKTE